MMLLSFNDAFACDAVIHCSIKFGDWKKNCLFPRIFSRFVLFSGMAGEGVRVFALAGFLPCLPNYTLAVMQKAKERVVGMIRKLGGRLIESDEWDPSITHVVTFVMGAREGLSEKVMAGIAAGRWVVTMRYVEKSYKAGIWLDTESAYAATPREHVLACRERVSEQGDSGRLFHGMVAALVMEDRRRAGVYMRIVEAGGGKVVAAETPLELVASIPADLTHVFMDPWIGKKDPPGFAQLNRMEGLHLCDYKLLFNMVRGTPDTSETEWSITGEKSKHEARERAKRAGGGIQRNKRVADQNGGSSKRQRTQDVETIDLDSDDEENINVAVTSTVTTTVVDIDIDSEDDIVILESRLEKEREDPASQGRRYLDREKAKGLRRTTNSRDVCLQQRREVSRGSAAHVDVISLSDEDDEIQEVHQKKSKDKDKDDEVTILDSDEEVMLVQNIRGARSGDGKKRSKRIRSISTPSRSPSPLGMQVEQDERGEVSSAEELDEVEDVGSRLLGDAPMIDLVDLDSTDDDEAVDLEVRENGGTPPPPPPNISLKPFLLASEQAGASIEKVDLTPSQISWLLPLPVRPKPAIKPLSESRSLLIKPTDQLPRDISKHSSHLTSSVRQLKPTDSCQQQKVTPPVSPMSSEEIELPEQKDLSPPRIVQQERSKTIDPVECPAEVVEPVKIDEPMEICESLDFGDPMNVSEEAAEDGRPKVDQPESRKPAIISEPVGVDLGKLRNDQLLDLQSTTEKEAKPRDDLSIAELKTAESEEIELLAQEAPNKNYISSDKIVWKPKVPSPKDTEIRSLGSSNDGAKANKPNNIGNNVKRPVECLPSPSSISAPPAAILPRIVATLQRRFTSTDEGIAISNINVRTARFDKHSEGVGEARYRQIAQGVEQDFASQLVTVQKERRQETRRQRRGNAGKSATQLLEPEEDGEVSPEDIETALKRLAIETSSDAHPSPALLHTVMVKLLLESRHSSIYSSAHSYLLHFLFLHAHRGRHPTTRKQWIHLVLSAFRDISDEKLFRHFDIANQHDIHSCLLLWKKLFQRLFETIEQFDNDEARYQETEGSWLLLSFLTLLLQRDFEMWWKHGRGKEDKNFPLLFYLLGGRNHILSSAGSSLLILFQKGLLATGRSRDLDEVRHLVAMVALLLSHLDSEDNCASLYRGSKLQLATQLATIIQETKLDAKSVFLELSLLQPSWLAVLVSRELLRKSCPALKSISLDYISPTLQLPQLNIASKPMVVVMEIWAHRLLGVQKAGAIFRRNWTFQRKEKDFSAFTMLRKLEEDVCKEMKILKIEEVSIKMSHVTSSVNKLSEFANGKEQFAEDVEVGALRALLFKMHLPDMF